MKSLDNPKLIKKQRLVKTMLKFLETRLKYGEDLMAVHKKQLDLIKKTLPTISDESKLEKYLQEILDEYECSKGNDMSDSISKLEKVFEENEKARNEEANAIEEYKLGLISFNQMWKVFEDYGLKREKDNLDVDGIDYGELITYEEIKDIVINQNKTDENSISNDIQKDKYKNFDGNPAHPEFFNMNTQEGDRFSGKPEVRQGTFIPQCPKIGGQKFRFMFSSDERSKDGSLWIELSRGLWEKSNVLLGLNQPLFQLQIIDKDDEPYLFNSNGITMEALSALSDEDFEYEMAFADGEAENGEFEESSKKVLSVEEVKIFKSYIRAFLEACFGEGLYTEDLENVSQLKETKKSKKGGCSGMLILPILIVGALLWCLFS